jgi:ketosteroid isomerase-like protein
MSNDFLLPGRDPCYTRDRGRRAMLSRDATIERLRAAYDARARGDKAALEGMWSPGATYRMAGAATLVAGFPAGPGALRPTVNELIDRFEFSDVELDGIVVDGASAVVRWSGTVATAGKEPVRSEVCDMLTLDDEGRIAGVIEFLDTALLARLLA